MSHCRFFVIRSLQISSGMQGRNDAIDRMMNVLVTKGGWFRRFSTRLDLFLVNRYWCLRVTDVILSGFIIHIVLIVSSRANNFAREYTRQINLCVTKRFRIKRKSVSERARQCFRGCAREVASISLQIAVNTLRS